MSSKKLAMAGLCESVCSTTANRSGNLPATAFDQPSEPGRCFANALHIATNISTLSGPFFAKIAIRACTAHMLQSDLRLAQTVAGKHTTTTTTTPPPMHTSTQARKHASTTTPANEREQAHAYRVYACRVESGQPGHHTCVGVAATLRDFQHDWRTAFLKSHPVQLQWHVTRPRHTKALATSHTTPCGRTASVRTYMIVHEHAQRKHLQQALDHGELRRFAGQISMDGITAISILRLSCIWEGVNDRH